MTRVHSTYGQHLSIHSQLKVQHTDRFFYLGVGVGLGGWEGDRGKGKKKSYHGCNNAMNV